MNDQPAKTSDADLLKGALDHYEEIASKAHHWSSIIPQAIRFYFANKHMEWNLASNPPSQGVEVIGFAENWINPDFNPEGTRICFILDGEWTSAKWDGTQDYWHAHCRSVCKNAGKDDFDPTHWMPLPPKPQ